MRTTRLVSRLGLLLACAACAACMAGGATNSDMRQSAKDPVPSWCHKQFATEARVTIPGSTAVLGRNGSHYALVVVGGFDCAAMAQLTPKLIGQLDSCAQGQDCAPDTSTTDIASFEADLESTPIRLITIAGTQVEVSVGKNIAMAQWPADVSPHALMSKFVFPSIVTSSNTAGDAVRPTGPSTSISIATGWRGCVAVPCLPSNCSGGDGPDRDRFAVPLFRPVCACPPTTSCKPPRTEDSCPCYDECCGQPTDGATRATP